MRSSVLRMSIHVRRRLDVYENLVYGFRGEAFMDDNSDGKVTIQELAANTAEDMAFADKQMAQFTLSASYPRDFVIANSRELPKPKVGTRLEIEYQGQWYRASLRTSKMRKSESTTMDFLQAMTSGSS